jgi:aspartokinase-like uncharacterized kinase
VIVIKVGGSQSRGTGLPALAQEIGRLCARYPVLVVPGGGVFADVVRDHYRRYTLSETTAHRMALLAMDQYGCLLGDLVPGSVLVTDILSARLVVERGKTPILLPSSLLIQADPLPHSWQVTSDAIAAWVAGLLSSSHLILLTLRAERYHSIDSADNRGGTGTPSRRCGRIPGNCSGLR